MKTFAVVSRGDKNSDELTKLLKDKIELELDNTEPDLVVTVGGDGTFLRSFQKFFKNENNPIFVGIHTGTLGFYSDWKVEEAEELINHINNDEPSVVEYPVLKSSIKYRDIDLIEEFDSINELTVTSTKTLVLDVFVNDEQFETFRGTGICVSTPSGSTAYNKSLGGAVVHPSVNVLQFSEMASINNNVYRTLGSPMILPSHHVITFKTVNDFSMNASFDNLEKVLLNVSQIEVALSERKAQFARYKPHAFWERVRKSFI